MAISRQTTGKEPKSNGKFEKYSTYLAAEIIDHYAKEHNLHPADVSATFLLSRTGKRLMDEQTEYWALGFVPIYREFEKEMKQKEKRG